MFSPSTFQFSLIVSKIFFQLRNLSLFMFRLLRKLIKIRLLTFSGLFGLVRAVLTEGINLMTLLKLAAGLHKNNSAIADERGEISFQNLYLQTRLLAGILHNDYQIKSKQKIALICRNHAALVKAMFAASRLGTDIYLLNVEMSREQFDSLINKYSFDFVVYDAEASSLLTNSTFQGKSIVSYGESSIESLTPRETIEYAPLEKVYSSNLIILTGGTTGVPKLARRKPSLFNFLNPFFALLTQLNLDEYKSVYVATPIYHGFGVATVFMGLILGDKMFLTGRFEARKGCDLIQRNKIEVVTLVPLMLQRMLNVDAAALMPLKCIISGGAPLNPALTEETFAKLGDKLFNLYGTSEAGFSVMATPKDLRYDSRTIGRKIPGVKLKILDAANRETQIGKVGRICIKNKWTMNNGGSGLIETGDLGYRDAAGRLFLCGRNDEMIVSGGENVYPIELENILMKHPNVKQVAVIGIPDDEFGQRLKAFIVPKNEVSLTETEIISWLAGRVARFQMPARIVFVDDLPVTALGKPNKKLLS